MNASLSLCSRRSNLKPKFSIIKTFAGYVNTLDTGILQTMTNSLHQIRNVSPKSPFVDDCTADSLSYLDLSSCCVPYISLFTTFVHRFDTSHASITFQTHSILVKILTWSFIRSCQHATHHNATRSER